jgi:DNA-binding PadR family transcriptional regulator
MEVNTQYKQLLELLHADTYVDMSRKPTAVTIALEDMEHDGLIEASEPGSLEYRLTEEGVRVKKSWSGK